VLGDFEGGFCNLTDDPSIAGQLGADLIAH
jgi:hypothetical protein